MSFILVYYYNIIIKAYTCCTINMSINQFVAIQQNYLVSLPIERFLFFYRARVCSQLAAIWCRHISKEAQWGQSSQPDSVFCI